MALIDAAFLLTCMPTEDYNRVFDRNATGTIDATFVTNCIAAAETTANMILNGGGAITLPLDRSASVVDRGVLVAIARMAIYEGTRFHPSDGQGAKSPWRLGYEDAVSLLTQIKQDQMRFRTASLGDRSFPRAEAFPNDTNADGNTGPIWSRTLDGRDNTGY